MRHPRTVSAAPPPLPRHMETGIEPVPCSQRLTTNGGVTVHLSGRAGRDEILRAPRWSFAGGSHAIDCQQPCHHQPSHDQPGAGDRLRRMPARAADLDANSAIDTVTVYPDGASVTRVITLDLASGDSTLVAKDFPLTLDPSSLRVEGEAGAKLTIGAIDARPPRAAPPVNLPELDKRIEALKDERANLQGAIAAAAGAAQIRRAFCRSVSGRHRRQGRGAPDRRMARGLCRGRRGNRGRGNRDPRRRAQAARDRPRDRAAGSRPFGQAAEQARGPDRSRRRCRDQGDAARHLCGAQCALGAAL